MPPPHADHTALLHGKSTAASPSPAELSLVIAGVDRCARHLALSCPSNLDPPRNPPLLPQAQNQIILPQAPIDKLTKRRKRTTTTKPIEMMINACGCFINDKINMLGAVSVIFCQFLSKLCQSV
ncbi:hypothetical protein Dimus_018909 [Dionaea muscipula]